eukprot:350192-Chlamydomonas_euryale.AAC.3
MLVERCIERGTVPCLQAAPEVGCGRSVVSLGKPELLGSCIAPACFACTKNRMMTGWESYSLRLCWGIDSRRIHWGPYLRRARCNAPRSCCSRARAGSTF